MEHTDNGLADGISGGLHVLDGGLHALVHVLEQELAVQVQLLLLGCEGGAHAGLGAAAAFSTPRRHFSQRRLPFFRI